MIQKLKSNQSQILASTISTLTSPAVVALIFLAIEINRNIIFSVEFLIFVIIQLSLFLPVYFTNYLNDPQTTFRRNSITRKQRELMYTTLIIGSIINVALFAQESGFRYFISLGMIMTVFWGLMYIINKVLDKLSVHTGMLTFVIVALAGSTPASLALILLLPAVCWSRITLHKHTWFQLILGMMVGAVCGILFWSL